MPSKSRAQHDLMEAVAHNPSFARAANIPQTVGREFVEADAKRGKKFSAMPKNPPSPKGYGR